MGGLADGHEEHQAQQNFALEHLERLSCVRKCDAPVGQLALFILEPKVEFAQVVFFQIAII